VCARVWHVCVCVCTGTLFEKGLVLSLYSLLPVVFDTPGSIWPFWLVVKSLMSLALLAMGQKSDKLFGDPNKPRTGIYQPTDRASV
jgi:hypothetical protein